MPIDKNITLQNSLIASDGFFSIQQITVRINAYSNLIRNDDVDLTILDSLGVKEIIDFSELELNTAFNKMLVSRFIEVLISRQTDLKLDPVSLAEYCYEAFNMFANDSASSYDQEEKLERNCGYFFENDKRNPFIDFSGKNFHEFEWERIPASIFTILEEHKENQFKLKPINPITAEDLSMYINDFKVAISQMRKSHLVDNGDAYVLEDINNAQGKLNQIGARYNNFIKLSNDNN
jgi:hypothetical protein